jgi:tetratricopeptide (TPR) repeat protein
MLRWILALTLVSLAPAQQAPPKKPPQKELETKRPKPAASSQEEIPPEEDTDLTTTEYSFNPLQSQKDISVGNMYFKNHKYRAAELRYTSATKWNDGNADAWLKLGEVEERLKNSIKAKEAYRKYLDLASSDSKDARKVEEIRKKVGKLK